MSGPRFCGRSQLCRPPWSQPCIRQPSGANLLHPKPSEAKPGNARDQAMSATDQCRSRWQKNDQRITEADNINTPAHA